MPPRVIPARIHLIPAKDAPYLAVIRRKPADRVHVSRWNTDTGEIEHGGWYVGRVYERQSDISFDGEWWVFGAYGKCPLIDRTASRFRYRRSWSGVARLPGFDLQMVHPDISAPPTGGFFPDSRTLLAAGYPVSIAVKLPPFDSAEDEPYVYNGFDDRMKREGWERQGAIPQWIERKGAGRTGSDYVIDGDPGWMIRSADQRLTLRMFERGLFPRSTGITADFRIDEAPDLLDRDVTWACFDCRGRLAVARAGRLELYATSDEVLKGAASFVHDLEHLTPPTKDGK